MTAEPIAKALGGRKAGSGWSAASGGRNILALGASMSRPYSMSSKTSVNNLNQRINGPMLLLRAGDWAVLLAAFLSFLFSIALWFGIGLLADKSAGIFVGIWVPSILATGIYLHVARATAHSGRYGK